MRNMCYAFFTRLMVVLWMMQSVPAFAVQPLACQPTIMHTDASMHLASDSIRRSNNLRYFPGSVERAKGEEIIIRITVRNAQCVPVEGTVFELWQADANGVWLLHEDITTLDANFVGSGTSYADNHGNAHFSTIMPAIHDEFTFSTLFIRALHGASHESVYKIGLLESDEDIAEELAMEYSVFAKRAGTVDGVPVYNVSLVIDSKQPFGEF